MCAPRTTYTHTQAQHMHTFTRASNKLWVSQYSNKFAIGNFYFRLLGGWFYINLKKNWNRKHEIKFEDFYLNWDRMNVSYRNSFNILFSFYLLFRRHAQGSYDMKADCCITGFIIIPLKRNRLIFHSMFGLQSNYNNLICNIPCIFIFRFRHISALSF